MKQELRIKEYINKRVLDRLIRVQSPLITKEQYDKLLQLQKCKGQSHVVIYTKNEYDGISSGRYLASNKVSMQSLSSALRGILCDSLCVDVDMQNSNLNIVENLARIYKIEHSFLTRFNKNREDILTDLGKELHLPRKVIKILFTSLVCGGSPNTWMKTNHVEKQQQQLPAYVYELERDIRRIRDILLSYEENHKYVDIAIATQLRKKSLFFNVEGSAFSFMLQDIESQLLLCFVERAKNQHKLHANTLMHDGALFRYEKGAVIPDPILRDMEDYVFTKLGYTIHLICKPHEIHPELLDDAHVKTKKADPFYINNGERNMDEVYESKSMRPYPMDKAITCIKANMGTGKTVELENLIHRIPRNKKMLIVSYAQTLCDTYITKFEKYGFKLYKDMSYQDYERESRIIICLDSIYKLSTGNDYFDYIFMDECLSVFEHFDSEKMREVRVNSITLTSCLMRAEHLYFIDANADSSMIVDIVEWLEKKRHVQSYWIHNTYRRETNRKAYLMKNYDQQTRVSYLMSLLSEGKKIICPCSSKAMVDVLYETAITLHPHLRAKKYTSETSRKTLYEDTKDPNKSWKELDLLIYSPTISAGISFEVKHFDVLVAFFESSMPCATVGNCVQQLYRARALNEGAMHIFINECKYYHLPITSAQVQKSLETGVNHVSDVLQNYHKFVEMNPTTYKREYNKEEMSFQIVKNITLSKNQSLMHFESLLKNALNANGVPYETILLDTDKTTNHTKQVKVIQPTEENDIKKHILTQFEKNPQELVLNRNEMVCIEKAMSNNKVDIPKEMKIKRFITMNLEHWNAKINQVTMKFFKKYVLSVNDLEHKQIHQMIACAHRYDRLDKPLVDAYKRLERQFLTDSREGDHNFTLFRNLSKTGHQQEIETKKMLIHSFGAQDGNLSGRICGVGAQFKSEDWKPKLVTYLKSMTEKEYQNLLCLFQLHTVNKNSSKTTSYQKIDNFVVDNSRLPAGLVKAMMKKTYNIDFIQSPCKNFMTFDNTFWKDITFHNTTFLTNKAKFLHEVENE